MIAKNLSTLKIHRLTQAQYDRELEAGNIDENALYLTPDEVTSVANGGTGATTANAARANLGAIGMLNGSITLAQGDWYLGDDGLYHNDENDGNCYGVTPESTVFVAPDPATDSFNRYVKHGIRCFGQLHEALFFVANTDPNESDDIVVNYTVFS